MTRPRSRRGKEESCLESCGRCPRSSALRRSLYPNPVIAGLDPAIHAIGVDLTRGHLWVAARSWKGFPGPAGE
jgi:hypothetical protein